LNKYCYTEVDYEGMHCSKYTWFSKLPPVMMLYITPDGTRTNNTRLKLRKEIQFQKYTYANKEESLKHRKIEQEIRKHIKDEGVTLESVNLTCEVIEKPYELIGAWLHKDTLQTGHYTAFYRDISSKSWYRFNDHEVYKESDINVLIESEKCAVMLVYGNQMIHSSVSDWKELIPFNRKKTLDIENNMFSHQYQPLEEKLDPDESETPAEERRDIISSSLAKLVKVSNDTLELVKTSIEEAKEDRKEAKEDRKIMLELLSRLVPSRT